MTLIFLLPRWAPRILLAGGVTACSWGAAPTPPEAPTADGPGEARSIQGPTEGCPDGGPLTSLDGYEGPKPPLDDDGIHCAIVDGALHVTHIRSDVGSVAHRYMRHFSTHDFEVPGADEALPVELPVPLVVDISQGDATWALTFTARDGDFVDVVMASK